MNLDNIIKKIDAKEKLDENEIADLLYEAELVEEEASEKLDRWSRSITTIVEYDGRYFQIDWEQGLTEMQDNSYPYQPVEVYDGGYREETVKHKIWKYKK